MISRASVFGWEQDIAEAIAIPCDRAQANYLLNVLRMEEGDLMLIFNGRDGEWRRVEVPPHGAQEMRPWCRSSEVRPQPLPRDSDPALSFRPRSNLPASIIWRRRRWKMGASRLRPVFTQHTQERRPKLDKMRVNVIEAAEQCGILAIPPVDEPVTLTKLLDGWEDAEEGRHIIFCDEGELGSNPLAILDTIPWRGRGCAAAGAAGSGRRGASLRMNGRCCGRHPLSRPSRWGPAS